jgi:Transcriptional activator TraM
MIDREQLVADLAKVHGVRLNADDPVLVAALLNERLLDAAIARLDTTVRASADRITTAAAQQVDGAKKIAATFVTQAGEWSAERLRTAADEAGSALLLQVRQEVARAERAGRTAIRIAWIMGGMGAVALAGLAGFLLAGLGHV